MKRLLHIVDSFDYISSNCFQHQLQQALYDLNDWVVDTVSYNNLDRLTRGVGSYDSIVSCLKQRTLFRESVMLKQRLRDAPITVYDQDPWQAYMDDSPFKGAYEHIASHLNIKTFAVTTKWWCDFINDRGLPSTFVKMWVLPKYCNRGLTFEQRKGPGFVGSLHPRRKMLVDMCNSAGIQMNVLSGNALPYEQFLSALSNLSIFVHNEDMPIFIDGKEHNFNTGMWVKDIEALARGCYSVRSRASGHETYLAGLESAVLYDDIRQVPDIINGINNMDSDVRQASIDKAVKAIEGAHVWHETASILVD